MGSSHAAKNNGDFMRLYILPGACSLAANIVLREAGIPFELVKLNHHTHKTPEGVDLKEINSKDYVPALLPYIADLKPEAKLAPPVGTLERYRMSEWLSYINSEVHKGFSPLFAKG